MNFGKGKKSLVNAVGVALAAALVASSCSSGTASPAASTGGPDSQGELILLSASLETLDSCDAVLERIKQDASARVGPYGLDQPFAIERPFENALAVDDFEIAEEQAIAPKAVEGDAMAEDRASDAAETTGSAAVADDAAKATSGTNNQEDGVDEADLVKSDGETLVVITGSELRVLDVSGEQPALTETIDIENLGQATGMFLNGDDLVLLSVDYDRNGLPTSLVTEIDLVTGDVGGSAEFEGEYVSSREVDGTLRLVITAVPSELDFVYPDGRTTDSEALKENQAIIDESTLEDWVPEYRITGNTNTQASEQLVDCSQVHIPKTFSGGGQVVVVTAELDDPLTITDALSIHTDAQTVYASTDRLVVASPQWPDLTEATESRDSKLRTALHSFDIGEANSTSYVASGSVRGLLLNQFSLSEHDGHLRVATTDQGISLNWPLLGDWETFPGIAVEQEVSESYVTILSEEDGALVADGQVGGLGRGEQIYAVRFLGEVGYVVTFREIDPLYTVDLSDPSNPEVIGELKIPGFSNYLHEIDERTLMGIGSDGTDDGQILGASVSLFDVEDLSDPTRLDKLTFDADSSTPIASDAKAFTYWRETNTAIVPVDSYGTFPDTAVVSPGEPEGGDAVASSEFYGGYLSQAAVIDVDPNEGRVELRGTIDHRGRCDQLSTSTGQRRVPSDDAAAGSAPLVSSAPNFDDWYYICGESLTINRTMVIGEDLFTFSNAGIAVHTLSDLDEKAWISFSS